MDKAEFHYKEYERALGFLDQSERTLDRLALIRMLFLVAAFLFLRNYLISFNEIRDLRSHLDTLSVTDKESTVFGFITAHQMIQNSVFVPDEAAKSLIDLIPKLGTFLGEDLTLENQASRPISEILHKSTKKPERISLENQYLPRLSVPVSYSALSLFVFLIVLVSYFNFSFRRFRMSRLVAYIQYNLKCFQELAGFDEKDRALVRSRLYLRRFTPGRSRFADEKAVIPKRKDRASAVWHTLTSLLLRLLEMDGDSPFLFLISAITLGLFAALSVVTVEIISGESGLPRGWFVDPFYILAITLPPAWALHKLNEYVKSRFDLERQPFLPTGDDTY
jgi:hypothetical protein